MKLENIVIRWYDTREAKNNNSGCRDCRKEYVEATQLLMTVALELKNTKSKKSKISHKNHNKVD